jgi:hypothetical protein
VAARRVRARRCAGGQAGRARATAMRCVPVST